MTGEFPHKWPLIRQIFSFDNVIMSWTNCWTSLCIWYMSEIPAAHCVMYMYIITFRYNFDKGMCILRQCSNKIPICTFRVPRITLLTLNMLNYFKDDKRCIHISYRALYFLQQKKTKFTTGKPYILHIIYCQCYSFWCPGDLRNSGISRHGIEQICLNIPPLASEELTLIAFHQWKCC